MFDEVDDWSCCGILMPPGCDVGLLTVPPWGVVEMVWTVGVGGMKVSLVLFFLIRKLYFAVYVLQFPMRRMVLGEYLGMNSQVRHHVGATHFLLSIFTILAHGKLPQVLAIPLPEALLRTNSYPSYRKCSPNTRPKSPPPKPRPLKKPTSSTTFSS